MNNIVGSKILPPTSAKTIDRIKQVEVLANQEDQVDIETQHIFHAGVYTRSLCVPAGVMITGALIKIPTTLTISGDCIVLMGNDERIQVKGFMVMPASAGRKMIFIAQTDTYMSMQFKTDKLTVKEAELEFTDDVGILKSRVNANTVTITGE